MCQVRISKNVKILLQACLISYPLYFAVRQLYKYTAIFIKEFPHVRYL
jgi:hypothetical protein